MRPCEPTIPPDGETPSGCMDGLSGPNGDAALPRVFVQTEDP
jgi:hypothetical protein